MEPIYRTLYETGKLEVIKDELIAKLESCELCPRKCCLNRKKEKLGFCKTGRYARVSSVFLHHGEERELVGRGGSGTIFFSWCNLGCNYCQNYTLSHFGEGETVSPQELARMMLALQASGAENINFVTPTHVIAQIVEALPLAIRQGLHLPLVYNCGGYESVPTLALLEGIFDIYMPDLKYSDNETAQEFSSAPDYWDIVRAAAKEMYRQVGDLTIAENLARRGVLVRHLVLPNRLAGSFKVLDFIRDEISPHTYVNIMQQYRPCYRGGEYPQLARTITDEEFYEVVRYAKKVGLYRGF